MYVFGRRASLDFHDVALMIGPPFCSDDVAASNVRNCGPLSCGVVVLGNSDGLVWLPSLPALPNDFAISDCVGLVGVVGNWVM